MKAPLHHLLYRLGLIAGLVVSCGFGLFVLLTWDGLIHLPARVGQWLTYLLDLV